jgi:Flp pilus assembly protein TadD
MIGNTPVYYNNIGYSHLLRGDLRTARRYFLKAYELDPGNEVTARNLELMKNSVNYAQRG